MRGVLILRPQPGAGTTARRAAALGITATVAPLFNASPVAWSPPAATQYDAALMTSAQAARLGGAGLTPLKNLPLYAVGTATGEAARKAGFSNVIVGEGDGAAILARAASDGIGRLLHLAGRDHIPLSIDQVRIDRTFVYAADPVAELPDEARIALRLGAVALLHSPRAAALFARLVDGEPIDRADIRVAALSEAVLDAAGEGWSATAIAARPDDEALLAIAAQLCDQKRVGSTSGGEDRT